MTVNASRKRSLLVSSIRLIASPVAAIESRRSFRWTVRNVWRVSSSSNCSMAIMFTGPRRSIFALRAAMASSGVAGSGGGWTGPAPPRPRPPRLDSDRRDSRVPVLIDRVLLRLVGHRRARARPGPSRSASSTSASTWSSVACTASTQVDARCARSDSAVTRTSSSSRDLGADAVERPARLADGGILGVGSAAAAPTAARRPRGRRPRRRSRSWTSRSRRALPSSIAWRSRPGAPGSGALPPAAPRSATRARRSRPPAARPR